ncbi:DUF1998 domain-containing protein [Amycolatopsis sp. La24]|uniref:DUF1998 domain-containing protein n=1 Tax=Amycolatopsis sp. La24 TaxID=3028304 RepID=UPI0023AE9509|nr:DUF1998 domain-containing protein [Amycolatopsis sp. La24]
MALRNPGRSGRKAVPGGPVSKTPLGGVRSAQMITTYGVGAMVAVEDSSYVVSGLDTWSPNEKDTLYEPRLQKWLHVGKFYGPPANDPPSGDGVRVRRFPEWYSCSKCHELKPFKRFGTSSATAAKCAVCEISIVPSRFVMACENGHLDDFPYWAWVHKKNRPADDYAGNHELELHSDGRTASLRSVVISCSCGLESSMEGAFGRRALELLGVQCRGRRPWLGAGSEEPGCDAQPRTLQRGASAAWFAVNRSSLSIPPWSDVLQKAVDKHYATLAAVAGQPNESAVIESLDWVRANQFTVDDVVKAVRQHQRLLAEEVEDEPTRGLEATESFRLQEYDPLYYGQKPIRQGDDFECVRPDDHEDVALPYRIGRSMLVKRLREVRALESFTRVEAPDQLSDRKRYAALSRGRVDWLPAIEVSGEGVFLTLDPDALSAWEASAGPAARGASIRASHAGVLAERVKRRGGATTAGAFKSVISPRYVLLHTLAHALINEWSLDAGYPAASLRERLYVSDWCAGLLIYTATSDSAGSLGGVVAQGNHARLQETLYSAINRVAWCSQDPPCMETEASGVDSLNLAACYACVMLPESSCETNNTFLDRALLIGTPDDGQTGFFHRLLSDGA